MIDAYQISEPFLFNPLKHHLGFIKEYIYFTTEESNTDIRALTRDLKHLGTSVMDVYTGSLSVKNICRQIEGFLRQKNLLTKESCSCWAGISSDSSKIIALTDGSQWTLKYSSNHRRYLHIFPARFSQHTFRVKSNTIKSALIYYILIGKDMVTRDDLNKVRALLDLSPIKDIYETKAILEMIDILRA